MRIDYKLSDKFDFGIYLTAVALILIGIAAIYSSTVNHPTAEGNFDKQIIWGIISLIVFFVIYSVPTNWFRILSTPAYLFSIFLLIAVLLMGKRISGSQSWIEFGSLGFQPSEFAKIATIMALAYFLSRQNTDIESFKDILKTLAIGMFPVALVLLQPDLGTSIVFIGFSLILIFWKGISIFGLFVVISPMFVAVSSLFGIYYFIGAMILVAGLLVLFRQDLFFSGSIFALNLAAGFFTDIFFKALSPHQQDRIKAFIDPTTDPLGSGYNSIQAQVAIGSGGLFGKGFLAGNQTQLQYIPEQWTDFVFCVIGEEFGFLGSIIILLLFLILFHRLLKIASMAKDEFSSLMVIGIFSVYFVHFIINVGMVAGILPIIGIPLPFVSYGGSSLLANTIMLAIVANIFRTRKSYT